MPNAIESVYRTYANDRVAWFIAIVARWEHKPSFTSSIERSEHLIKIRVIPVGENAQIWIYVDRGTGIRGGWRTTEIEITPNGDYPLRFRGGYSAYTERPARYNVGTGEATGDFVQKQVVYSKGIEPRGFTEEINTVQADSVIEDIAEKFYSEIRGI